MVAGIRRAIWMARLVYGATRGTGSGALPAIYALSLDHSLCAVLFSIAIVSLAILAEDCLSWLR